MGLEAGNQHEDCPHFRRSGRHQASPPPESVAHPAASLVPNSPNFSRSTPHPAPDNIGMVAIRRLPVPSQPDLPHPALPGLIRRHPRPPVTKRTRGPSSPPPFPTFFPTFSPFPPPRKAANPAPEVRESAPTPQKSPATPLAHPKSNLRQDAPEAPLPTSFSPTSPLVFPHRFTHSGHTGRLRKPTTIRAQTTRQRCASPRQPLKNRRPPPPAHPPSKTRARAPNKFETRTAPDG